MAVRPAGSSTQNISWYTAPTFHTEATGVVEFKELAQFIKNPSNLPFQAQLVPEQQIAGNVYPSGWSQENNTGRIRATNAGVVARKTLRWVATAQGKASVRSPPGGYVETVAVTTLTPTVPQDVVADATGTDSAEVRWSPGAVGGSEITAYRVYQGPSNTGPWTQVGSVSAATFTHPVSGLDPNTVYWFTVEAFDGTATSSKAVPDDARTFQGAPTAPLNVQANGTAPNTIHIIWVASLAEPLAVAFRVYFDSAQGGSFSTQVGSDVTAPTAFIDDSNSLDPLEDRWYKVSAVDASGAESAKSEPAVMGTTLAPAKPSVPLAFEVHPVTDTQIDGSWAASSGGVAPLKYNLYRQKVAGGPWDLFQPNLTTPSFSHTGITPNKTLCYKVTAIDADAQESGESQVKCATTYLYEVPQAPVSVQVLPDATHPTTALRVTWTPAAVDPVPEKYRVYWATSSGGTYTPFGTEPTDTSYTESGLDPAQTRYYKIKAINIVNAVETESTGFSPVGSGTTNGLPVPGTPANVVATALDANTIRTTWDAGPGGTPTGYRIFRSSTGAAGSFTQIPGTVDLPASPTSYEDATLQPGDRRWYALKALDSATSYVSNLSLDDDAQTPVVETGRQLYVSPSGNGVNSGLSSSAPKQTFVQVMNLAIPGDTVNIMAGTYATPLITVRNGPITIRAHTGASPVITGTSGESSVWLNHAFIDFGEGIEVRGNCTGTTSSWQNAQPTFSLTVAANDCTVRGRYRGAKNGFIRKGGNYTRLRMIDVDADLCGTLDNGGVAVNKGEGLVAGEGSSGDLMVYRSRSSRGGHNSAFLCNSGKQRVDTSLMTNDWQSIWGPNMGNRIFEMRTSHNRTLVVDTVYHSGMQSPDSLLSTNFCKNENGNTLWLRNFMLNHIGGDGMLAMQTTPEYGSYGARDQRYAHITFWKSNGTMLKFYDNNPSGGGYDLPFYFINCLFAAHTGQRVINMQYRSSRGLTWQQLLHMDHCVFDSNYAMRFQDLDGNVTTVTTDVNGIEALNPNCTNISIAAPQFALAAIPASTDPVTALAQARANFLPGNAALIGSGTHLTTVNGAVSNPVNKQITVADGKWFYDSMGFADASGAAIFIEGGGARTVTGISGNVLTLNTTVTCANGAKVYLGGDATPNIGAA